jgi:hypothetical protein
VLISEGNTHLSTQKMTNLEENFGSQSLQREDNVVPHLFAHEIEASLEGTELLGRNEEVGTEQFRNTKDILCKWLESANIDLILQKNDSCISDKYWEAVH